MPDIHSVHHPQRNFGFVLLPGFSLLDLAAATECLNNANALLGYEAYRWRTFALGTQHAVASNGITLRADCATDKPVHADRMFVLAEQHPETAGDAPLLGWLRTLDKSGCKVGAIGSGTYTLARAELIGERACTVHWQSAPKLCEAFPAIRLSGNIFAIDAGLLTCSGGTAVVDMLMRLVTHDHGRDICEQLQSHLHVERARTECDPQQTVPLVAINARPRKFQTAIRQMEAQLQTLTSPNHIAAQIGVTTRHLQRLFQAHTGASPGRFYMNLRLRKARLLLQQTHMPVLDVAVAVGFTSHSHFSKRYRERYGVTPVKHRATH
jgi:transcriptional regulator GlxA family with amidase domain